VTLSDPEAYAFDEEVLKKAADLGKPGLVTIVQQQDRFIFRVESTGVLPVRREGGIMAVACVRASLFRASRSQGPVS
jgi:hypothetical protein